MLADTVILIFTHIDATLEDIFSLSFGKIMKNKNEIIMLEENLPNGTN